jgi:hypothetical protein
MKPGPKREAIDAAYEEASSRVTGTIERIAKAVRKFDQANYEDRNYAHVGSMFHFEEVLNDLADQMEHKGEYETR